MKKVFLILLIGMFAVSSCKSTSGVTSSNSNKNSVSQETNKTESSSNSKMENESSSSNGVSNPTGLSTKPVGGTQSTPIKKSPPGSK